MNELQSYLVDFYFKLRYPTPHIKSIEETIEKIVKDKCSIARYGDGEMEIMKGNRIPFQSNNSLLSRKMRAILRVKNDKFLVCLPDVFDSLSAYTEDAKEFWRKNLRKNRSEWHKLLSKDNVYYNAFVSRFYIEMNDKRLCKRRFELIKKIWEGRDIVLVEGDKSRLGVENDLFSNTKTVRRILCPNMNAFAKYQEIIKAVNKIDKEALILIALGPTATALAYDLFRIGYQAIDIGHIDIQYEWYLQKAISKVPIKNKYTNEVMRGRRVTDIDNALYKEQIIESIL